MKHAVMLTWVHGGQRGGRSRNQEKTLVWGHLGLSSKMELSWGLGKENALFSTADYGPVLLRTTKILHIVGRTHTTSFSTPNPITKVFDSACIFDSKSAQRELKYLEEKEFSPRYVFSLPQSLGVSAFLFMLFSSASNESLLLSLSQNQSLCYER